MSKGRATNGREFRERIDAELAHWGVVCSTDSQGRAIYEVTCGECGKHESKFNPGVNKPEDILKPYRNQGWIFGYHCSPFHTTACKRVYDRKQKHKRKEEEHPMQSPRPPDPDQLTVQDTVERHTTVDPPAASVAIGTNPVLLVKVVTLLNDHFDKTTHLYEAGWDDARVAREAGTSEVFVKNIRLTGGYGELAEDPALTKLRGDIAALKATINAQGIEYIKLCDALTARLDKLAGVHHKASG